MKALIVTAQHTLELQDIPAPTPGTFDALVKINACGICNTTDTELVKGTQPYHKSYPALLGHEGIGTVVAVGKGVTSFKPGDRVTRPMGIFGGTSCNGITSCWGGFAEYGLVRDRKAMVAAGDAAAANDYTLVRQNAIRPGLTLPQAVLAISLAETASWSWQIGPIGGKRVCVSGTGIAGYTIALWCKLAGAKQVIVLGRRDARLAKAREIAADDVVNVTTSPDVAKDIQNVSCGGVDIFCEATGSPDQFLLACKVLREGGLFARYAVAPKGGYTQPATLPNGITQSVPEASEHLAYEWASDMLLRGKIDAAQFLTHTWPLADYAAAFATVERGEVVKGILVL